MTDILTLDLFQPLVGQTFTVTLAPGFAVPLTLFQATLMTARYPNRGREPFQLRFYGPHTAFLDQRTHTLDHPQFGSTEIFLVPIGQEEKGYIYQAVYT